MNFGLCSMIKTVTGNILVLTSKPLLNYLPYATPVVSPAVSKDMCLHENIQQCFQKSESKNILLINNDSPVLPSFWAIWSSSGRFSSYHPGELSKLWAWQHTGHGKRGCWWCQVLHQAGGWQLLQTPSFQKFQEIYSRIPLHGRVLCCFGKGNDAHKGMQ